MATRFGYIFWGLLLVILDFKFNGFDLLPDVLGYVLVGIGAGGLHATAALFSLAGSLAWVLAVACVLGFFSHGEVGQVLGLVTLALDCAMTWVLLGGVKEYALQKARADLADQAQSRRVAYVVLMAMVTLLGYAAAGLGGGGGLLVVGIVIGILVVLVMILRLIYRVQHELAARDDGLWDDPRPQ